jgi:secernin
VCDTLCLIREKDSIFAKNSDRPVSERQLVRSYPARGAGGVLETQYLTIDDTGAISCVLSQPTWLWGAEHGVNAHHVAIGNAKVFGTSDPHDAPPALIGMDLVRLGLERGRTAEEAIEVMTGLLERHGQGGVADATTNEPYWSSFLVVDPRSAWVMETCARTWVARRTSSGGAAISNRLTIRDDWDRASSDVATGADFDQWRQPDAPTGHADKRLGASLAFLATARRSPEKPSASASLDKGRAGPAQAVSHLRDHGSGPWGAPGSAGETSEPPTVLAADGTGVTICMHLRGFQATTSSIVAELPEDLDRPARVWAALGSPCASVYVPFIVPPVSYREPAPVAGVLADDKTAHSFCDLRSAAEATPSELPRLRASLDDLEGDLWEEADTLSDDPEAWERFAFQASARTAGLVNGLVGARGTLS